VHAVELDGISTESIKQDCASMLFLPMKQHGESMGKNGYVAIYRPSYGKVHIIRKIILC
jgi:hypothetical protein